MSKVALIDADGLIYIACHNKVDSMSLVDKTLDECKAAIDDIITNILLKTESESYLLFLTVGKNFRYNVYPEYKANRKYSEKSIHFDDTKEYLKDRYKAVFGYSLEADDLLLIYSHNIPDSFIASPDKDLLGLEGTHYNPNKGLWVTVSKEQADINFWKSMIIGDTADNIKGIPGKGPKFADGLISNPIALQQGITNAQLVLYQYIEKFGEELGVEEFYKNYKVLKIKSHQEDVVINTPIEFKIKEDEQKERDSW